MRVYLGFLRNATECVRLKDHKLQSYFCTYIHIGKGKVNTDFWVAIRMADGENHAPTVDETQ